MSETKVPEHQGDWQ